MHHFPCPFCGPRDETEFHYEGEAPNLRPKGEVPPEAWAAYLYMRKNPKGPKRELWVHDGGCGAFFLLERDTLSHEVLAARPLDGEA
jgi:sarcosine oxidase subunit delta